MQFRAPLWDLLGEHRYGIYAVDHADGAGVFLPAGAGDRWLYGTEWHPSTMRPHGDSEAVLARRITAGAGRLTVAPRIERVGGFTFAAQIAERFRHEEVFLIGDAAHRITPRGGTGMNTAIADGFDLGWKLAWVLRGWASAALLDSYERERRPVAEHNLARSADPNGSRREVIGELRVDLGGRIPHHWTATPSGTVSTLDLVGDGLTLFTGPHPCGLEHATPTSTSGPPVAVLRLDHIGARALGIPVGGALLVRPDGSPVATLPASPRDGHTCLDRHPIERVWRAISDPAEMAAWFPSNVEGDRRVGAELVFRDDQRAEAREAGEPTRDDGPAFAVYDASVDRMGPRLGQPVAGGGLAWERATHVEPDRVRSATSDPAELDGWGATTHAGEPLRWDIEAVEDGTVYRLVHSGIGDDAELASTWHALLLQLDMWLAAGELVPADSRHWVEAYEQVLNGRR